MLKHIMSLCHDDITWCIESDCPVKGCVRNTVNMYDRSGLHSYANFKGTSECALKSEAPCMETCSHAADCFSQIDDPDKALQKLQDEYCDECVFATVEED